jgi:HD-GYP domain-containing protein (c-di-GMP phosphodiesterase class II)
MRQQLAHYEGEAGKSGSRMEFTAKGRGWLLWAEPKATLQESERGLVADDARSAGVANDAIGDGIDRALRFFDTHSLATPSMRKVLHHGVRARDLAVQIGTLLALPSAEIAILQLAAMTHDIGKSMVPPRIRDKKRALSILELGAARLHTLFGSRLLETMFADQPDLACRLSEVALFHHDRWDGKNSLSGLKRAEIPRLARIVAVADVFDALVSDTTQMPSGASERASASMRHERGRQFDPECVDALLEIAR